MKRVPIRLEYLFRSSPTTLFNFLTTATCLVRWFCDRVEIDGKRYTFIWNGGGRESAIMTEFIEDELFSLRWENSEHPREYLEFAISESEVTVETILTITDFCDEDEVEGQKAYWDSEMKKLRPEMGE